jgi:repressor LexA
MIEAHIEEGDLALVKPQPTALNGDIVVALINDEATIKRFFKEQDTIRLEPAHPSMKPLVIKEGEAELRIIGKVVAIIRKLGEEAIPIKR